MLISACLVFLCSNPGMPAQQSRGGLDSLATTLRARTAERRLSANQAWQAQQLEYFKAPDGPRLKSLAGFAPEIQNPLLSALNQELAAATPRPDHLRALVSLLAQSMNSSGADRLAQKLDALGVDIRLIAIPALAKRGGPSSVQALKERLSSSVQAERSSALLALLTHGPAEMSARWMATVAPKSLQSKDRIRALEALSSRTLPGDFALPALWYALDDSREQLAVVSFLQTHPDRQAEDFVLALVLDSNQKPEVRKAGLVVLEYGSQELKWRDTKRKLGAILRDKDGDPLAEEAAWVLHHLGEKVGTRYLLAGPTNEVKSNKSSWRAYLDLGEMQVRLGEFRDAYKNYSTAMRVAEARRGRLGSRDWLYASRAAAGARKIKDAGDWLARTSMSQAELAPYRNLPEFAPYLEKQPFKRLFGNP
jgi:HEAT repeat protein